LGGFFRSVVELPGAPVSLDCAVVGVAAPFGDPPEHAANVTASAPAAAHAKNRRSPERGTRAAYVRWRAAATGPPPPRPTSGPSPGCRAEAFPSPTARGRCYRGRASAAMSRETSQ